MGAVERIMFLEREAILCQMIYDSTQGLGSDGAVVGEENSIMSFWYMFNLNASVKTFFFS